MRRAAAGPGTGGRAAGGDAGRRSARSARRDRRRAHEDALRSIARSSYLQLDDDEAAVFRRLAVLDGPAGLPLVREVVSGGRGHPGPGSADPARAHRPQPAHGGPHRRRTGATSRTTTCTASPRDLLVAHGEEQAAYQRLADAVRSPAARGRPRGAGSRSATRSPRSSARCDRCSRPGCPAAPMPTTARSWPSGCTATSPPPACTRGGSGSTGCIAASPSGPWVPYATYALGYLSYWAGDTALAMRELRDGRRGARRRPRRLPRPGADLPGRPARRHRPRHRGDRARPAVHRGRRRARCRPAVLGGDGHGQRAGRAMRSGRGPLRPRRDRPVPARRLGRAAGHRDADRGDDLLAGRRP